jgi:very-short-patch-repair endonuclease
MSEPEVMLWSRLRRRGPDKHTFRRQHPFGSLILDFYCASARLAVEIDGATHWSDEEQARDEARDRWLQWQGVTVLRIPASELYRDLGGVADSVLLLADELASRGEGVLRLSPFTSRSSAGGPPPPRRVGGKSR